MFPSLFKEPKSKNLYCNIRELPKNKHVPFLISNKRSSIPFSLLHSDIWGSSYTSNIFETRWFVSFIDDYTTANWLFLCNLKSNVSHILPQFYNVIEIFFGIPIKKLCIDNIWITHYISSLPKKDYPWVFVCPIYNKQSDGETTRVSYFEATFLNSILGSNSCCYLLYWPITINILPESQCCKYFGS